MQKYRVLYIWLNKNYKKSIYEQVVTIEKEDIIEVNIMDYTEDKNDYKVDSIEPNEDNKKNEEIN